MKTRLSTSRIPTMIGVDAGAVVVIGQGETYLVGHEAHRLRAAHSVVRLAAIRQETRQGVAHGAHRLRALHAVARLATAHAVVRCKVKRSSKRMRVKKRITRGAA